MTGPLGGVSLLAAAGIQHESVGGQVTQLQLTWRTVTLAAQWQRVLDALQRGEGPQPAGAQLILALLAREVIVQEDDLVAVSTRGVVWHDGASAYIEWSSADDRWQDRRRLSSHTVKLVANGIPTPSRDDWSSAVDWACRQMGEATAPHLRHVLSAATAWWVDRIPTLLALHVTGAVRYQLLLRAAHARRVCSVEVEPPGPSQGPGLDRIDLWLHQARGRSDRTTTVARLLSCVRDAASGHRASTAFRLAVMSALEDLMPHACAEGCAQALLVAGTYAVVAEGGIRGRLLGRRTLQGYTDIAIPRLGPALIALAVDPVDLDGSEWSTVYASVIDGLPTEAGLKAAAFLAAFHRFVVARGGAVAVHIPSMDVGVDLPPGRTVWPHEVERAANWIVRHAHDADLARQAVVALHVMASRACRPSELASLRLADVVETPDGVSLAAAPLPSDGVGKTPAMRQRQAVSDAVVAAALLDLRTHRWEQAAADKDWLFGSPRSPRGPWRWPETMMLVRDALRIASGDPSITPYALRHAVISAAVADALTPRQPIDDAQRIAQASAHAGHAGLVSSRPYVHLLESPLAAWARRAVPDEVPLSLAGLQHVADGMRRRGAETSPLDQGTGPGLGPATEPAEPMPMSVVLEILRDHATRHYTPAEIGLRSGLPEAVVEGVLCSVGRTMRRARLIRPRVGASASALTRAVALHGAWWAAATEAKWASAASLLSALDMSRARLVVEAFIDCAGARSLSLDHPELAAPLVELLLDAATQGTTTVVIRCCGGQLDPRIRSWISRGARYETGKQRRGDPRMRLLVVQSGRGPSSRGRSASMHGVFGLVLALAARLDLTDGKGLS